MGQKDKLFSVDALESQNESKTYVLAIQPMRATFTQYSRDNKYWFIENQNTSN